MPHLRILCCRHWVLCISVVLYAHQCRFALTCIVECGKQPALDLSKARIVNGIEASEGSWPWIAAIKNDIYQSEHDYNLVCGGAILTEFWILTAGHCISETENTDVIGVGFHDFKNPGEEVQWIKMNRSYLHPDYDDSYLWNDIALIRLENRINFTDFIQPICLPPSSTSQPDNLNLAGWGSLLSDGQYSNVLLETTVPLVDMSSCQTALGEANVKEPENICAGGEDKDSCQGDSGGPAIKWDEQTNTFQQAGIVSWGIGCGDIGVPAVYTNVFNYLDWIFETMNMSSPVGEVDFKCLFPQCQPDEFNCLPDALISECISSESVCDGTEDCSNASDELSCTTPIQCTDQQIPCPSSINKITCISQGQLCDSIIDCPEDGWDESNCMVSGCPQHLIPCDSVKGLDSGCIRRSQRCDFTIDCQDAEDETNCFTSGSNVNVLSVVLFLNYFVVMFLV